MIRILILDDSPERHLAFAELLAGSDVKHVETAQGAIDQLENHGPWDAVFLDHDLGGEAFVESGPGTGYEVARWLADHPDQRPKIIILHTYNPTGAKNMLACLPNARWVPGAWQALGGVSDA